MRTKFLCAPMILLLLTLTGCGGGGADEALTLELRADFLAMTHCAGTASMTADYGDRVYDYTVDFQVDRPGETRLTITAPENLAGLTAVIAEGETCLVFEETQLETGPLSDDGLAPMDAIPALLTAMESGFISDTCTETVGERETLRICCRDPALEPGLGRETLLWFDKESHALLGGELRSDGFTVLTCSFSAFSMQ